MVALLLIMLFGEVLLQVHHEAAGKKGARVGFIASRPIYFTLILFTKSNQSKPSRKPKNADEIWHIGYADLQ
jgi:hypothetical protein